MKLTLLHVGLTPPAMQDDFSTYPPQFQNMFEDAGAEMTFDSIYVLEGEPFPSIASVEGVVITGSAAGVYEDHEWMAPLRDFIKQAYAAKIPMLGVCFGHQIMADALGGHVGLSEKGWGLGRQEYVVNDIAGAQTALGENIAIAASHKDQVKVPPADAEVFLSSPFAPNAGLVYKNGAAISVQPHPEFGLEFSRGLVELRRNNPLSDEEVRAMDATLDAPVDNTKMAKYLAQFLKNARQI